MRFDTIPVQSNEPLFLTQSDLGYLYRCKHCKLDADKHLRNTKAFSVVKDNSCFIWDLCESWTCFNFRLIWTIRDNGCYKYKCNKKSK